MEFTDLLVTLIVVGLTYIVGLVVGMQKERKRIQTIFRIQKEISYSEFYDILEDFEEEERERENLDTFLKSRKRK
jgi:Mg2+/citrate symporter